MKKKLIIVAIAVCVVAVLACGTLAFFTASSHVTNKFTAGFNPSSGGSTPTSSELFSVGISESGLQSGSNTNTYKDVIPGAKIAKNPTITNTGKYGQWVRVKVTFDKVSAWNAAGVQTADLFKTIVTAGYVKENWDTDAAPVVSGDKAVFTFYLKSALASKSSATLFTEVTVPASVTTEQMTALNGFTIKVTCDAIQSENTGASAKATFNNSSYWTEG